MIDKGNKNIENDIENVMDVENLTPEQQHQVIETEIEKAGHIATRKGAALYVGLAGIAFEISAIIDKTSGLSKQFWGSCIFIGICCLILSFMIYKLAKRDEQDTMTYKLSEKESNKQK